MIDLDRASLDRALPATPGAADWDDVMSRASTHHGRRRRHLVVLAAIALVVVGTASAVCVKTLVLAGGSTALPPQGATPSAPETGELVIHYDGRPGVGHPPVHQVWVYADGRLIWRDEAGPVGVADAAGEVRTGFLEQRLTPEGVELLRSEIVSTGLFDRDRSLSGPSAWNGSFWGTLQTRNGKRLVSVAWGGEEWGFPEVATAKQQLALSRLTEMLSDRASGLPAGAWEVREVRAYVPSRYAVCYWTQGESPPYLRRLLEPSRVSSLLPAAAQDVLRDKDEAYGIWNNDNTAQLKPGMCAEVTTDEARTLAEIFGQAGFEAEPLLPGGGPQGVWDNHRFLIPAPHDVLIAFEPILPHGQWEQMGG